MSRARPRLTRQGLYIDVAASSKAGAPAQFKAGAPAQSEAGAPAQFEAGAPALIQAGVLHYARLPAQALWRPLLARFRMMGLNAVVIPFPWAYHSPAPGFHDFTGPRNIRRLLAAAEHLGLWLIPSIGPWLGGGFDGGGLPGWLHRDPEAQPILAAAPGADAVPEAPAPHFLRHVAAWWEQLLPHLLQQPNLLWLTLHPGLTADGQLLHSYVRPLIELVRRLDPDVPVAAPEAALLELAGESAGSCMPWIALRRPELPAAMAPAHAATDAETPSPARVVFLDLALSLHWTGPRPSELARIGPFEHPRSLMLAALARPATAIVLDPMHHGVNWGWWAAPGEPTLAGFGAPLAELAAPTAAYWPARRTALTVETLGKLLVDRPTAPTRSAAPQLRADPSGALSWQRRSAAGICAVLAERTGAASLAHLSLDVPVSAFSEVADGPAGEDAADGCLTVEDIPLGANEMRVLPIDWALADGRLLSTTLEPVLHTLVAGRELIILRNDVGGEVLLPAEFRHRHSRGPVYPERAAAGVAVHIDPARIASIRFDGPGDHALQILALATAWADRVWPLDDVWRTTPYWPASWAPAEEAPARGVVIGPEAVVPEADGGFRLLAHDRGFGYRWGPWRGSDPHTWLAPLSWPAAPEVTLPALDWDARPGAPEVLPGYDDRAWRAFAGSAVMTAEALGVDAGFIWYRAHFDGPANAVTLACRHACDLFLNGAHIASLSAPPGDDPVSPKTLPLPARHLRERNVLALLVEHEGRAVYWDTATSPHGLITFALAGAEVDAWRVRAGLIGEHRQQGVAGFADWSLIAEALEPAGEGAVGSTARARRAVTWHRATFCLDLPQDVDMPVFLFLDQTPTKCYVYLNGQLIGRSWYPQQPERRFWLPDGLLHRDARNELLVAQWTRGASPGLGVARLAAGPPALWHRHAPA
jgi:hypothetical protein